MPTHCWKEKDGRWACRWGKHGKVYRSKDKARAKAKADAQGRAIKASGGK